MDLYAYNTISTDALTAAFAMLGSVLLIAALIALAVGIVCIVAEWKIFKKADEHGWAAIVPFYNSYVLAKITWGNGWIFVLPYVTTVLSVIVPSLSWLWFILTVAYSVITCWKLAKAFGHGMGFAVGLFFLSVIFMPILGFGSSQYTGVPQDSLSLKKE